MVDDDPREEIEITGQIDVSDELCSNGTEALAIVTADGDEYVIKNRKTVKRLKKYAYDQSVIKFRGYITHDPTGIELFSVLSYEPPEHEEDEPVSIPYEESEERRRHKRKKHRRDLDDEDDNEIAEAQNQLHAIINPDLSSLDEIESDMDEFAPSVDDLEEDEEEDNDSK